MAVAVRPGQLFRTVVAAVEGGLPGINCLVCQPFALPVGQALVHLSDLALQKQHPLGTSVVSH